MLAISDLCRNQWTCQIYETDLEDRRKEKKQLRGRGEVRVCHGFSLIVKPLYLSNHALRVLKISSFIWVCGVRGGCGLYPSKRGVRAGPPADMPCQTGSHSSLLQTLLQIQPLSPHPLVSNFFPQLGCQQLSLLSIFLNTLWYNFNPEHLTNPQK